MINQSEVKELRTCSICGTKFEYGIEAHPLGKWESFCSQKCADISVSDINTQLYRYQNDNGTRFKVEFLGMELVRITNLALDANMFKPYIISQHDFVTELHSDRIVRIN